MPSAQRCGDVYAADADLLVDGALIDVKTGVDADRSRPTRTSGSPITYCSTTRTSTRVSGRRLASSPNGHAHHVVLEKFLALLGAQRPLRSRATALPPSSPGEQTIVRDARPPRGR